MILQTSKRTKIKDIREFEFEKDPDITIENEAYPGDKGRVYDLELGVQNRKVRVLLFDTGYGRNRLLTGRFIYGKEARLLYRFTTATVAQALLRYFPEVLGYVEKAKEHQILRAGKVMALAPFIEGLHTQGDDFKRKPVKGGELFTAAPTEKIDWGPETTRIFSDICPASGSTMEAFTEAVQTQTKVERIVFNCSTTTINSLLRVIPKVSPEVQTTVILWEALFSVWRDDITLPGGEVIHGGTVINLNPDPDFPDFNPIAPVEVREYIHKAYQREQVELLPDIPGEVGEKIQDNWIGPLSYDFLEFYNAGVDLSKEPWQGKAKKAWNMSGVKENLKMKAPDVYKALKKTFGNGHPLRNIKQMAMI